MAMVLGGHSTTILKLLDLVQLSDMVQAGG